MVGDNTLAGLVGADDLDIDALRAKYAAERDQRLRPDAVRQYVRTDGEFAGYREDPNRWSGTVRDPVTARMDAVVVGAGFGGLLAGARLREAGVDDVWLVETGGDVGGAWYWNRYPGAQCDVESYTYLPLLEEMGYIPKEKYSYAPEIREYATRIAEKYGLYENALFGTEVTGAEWDGSELRWSVTTNRGDRLAPRHLVIANGPLSKPKLPAVEGIEDFEGHAFHSSRWDYSYTGGDASGGLDGLRDKRVGVLGTGASAMQIVPHLGRSAGRLFVFQRTAAAVAERNNKPTDPEWAASLETGWHRKRVTNFTAITSGMDVEHDLIDDSWTHMFPRLTPRVARQAAERLGRELTPEEVDAVIQMSDMTVGHELRSRVSRTVRDPVTAQALKPWWHLYCKRVCFHDDYLAAFNLPDVELVDTRGRGVERFTRKGAVVDGREYELDCLIFATGFEIGTELGLRAGFDPVGRAGRTLTQSWPDGPRTLYGMQAHEFPNMFVMGLLQGGSAINYTHVADEQARHIAYVIATARDRGAIFVEPTPEGVEGWLAEMREKAPEHARAKDCTPSYGNGEGDPDNKYSLDNTRYGGGALAYFTILEDWRAAGDLAGVEVR